MSNKINQLNGVVCRQMNRVAQLCERGLNGGNLDLEIMHHKEWIINPHFQPMFGDRTSNPIINEMKNLFEGVKDILSKDLSNSDNYKEISNVYNEYKTKLSNFPFEQNKADYVEAGVCIRKDASGNDVRYYFPLWFYETYCDTGYERKEKSDDSRDPFSYPGDICSANDYLEITSKINLYMSYEEKSEIENTLNLFDEEKFDIKDILSRKIEKMEILKDAIEQSISEEDKTILEALSSKPNLQMNYIEHIYYRGNIEENCVRNTFFTKNTVSDNAKELKELKVQVEDLRNKIKENELEKQEKSEKDDEKSIEKDYNYESFNDELE